MKITSVEVFKCVGSPPLNKPGERFIVTVPKINTDEGISGFGEVGVCYGVGAEAGFAMCCDYAKVILGMDPMNSEQIWHRLFNGTFWGNAGGAIINAARSAIDIACWDIRGKALNAPVYKLLGGKTNKSLRSYASQIQFGWGPSSKVLFKTEDYAQACKDAIADGYDSVKVDPIMFSPDGTFGWKTTGMLSPKHIRVAEERIAAIREAGGPDMDIIIELHGCTDTNTAIQLAEVLKPYGIYYYEEPTLPQTPHLYKEIKDKINIPLAGGERLFSRWDYRPFIESRALSVIQPDLCNCGGITESRKVCDFAALYDIAVQGHVCGGPISTAACLQLEAVIPNFLIHEQHQASIVQKNIDLCKYDYQPVNGYFEVPDLPGIGNELSEKAMRESECVIIK